MAFSHMTKSVHGAKRVRRSHTVRWKLSRWTVPLTWLIDAQNCKAVSLNVWHRAAKLASRNDGNLHSLWSALFRRRIVALLKWKLCRRCEPAPYSRGWHGLDRVEWTRSICSTERLSIAKYYIHRAGTLMATNNRAQRRRKQRDAIRLEYDKTRTVEMSGGGVGITSFYDP